MGSLVWGVLLLKGEGVWAGWILRAMRNYA